MRFTAVTRICSRPHIVFKKPGYYAPVFLCTGTSRPSRFAKPAAVDTSVEPDFQALSRSLCLSGILLIYWARSIAATLQRITMKTLGGFCERKEGERMVLFAGCSTRRLRGHWSLRVLQTGRDRIGPSYARRLLSA